MMKSIRKIWLRVRRSALEMAHDQPGVAAIEFAMIVPIMLVLFFGTVEFSSGVAVDRKVTLMARTMSDLTSQNTSVTVSPQLNNFFTAANAIMTPYPNAPTTVVISELWINSSLQARVQWSQGYGGANAHSAGTVLTIPSALAVAGTYLIFSEVSYLYKPTIGYVMNRSGITLSDVAYTRPRQQTCVYLSPSTTCTTL